MITQDLIDCINLIERSTQTRCRVSFFTEVICPAYKNYDRKRFEEICEYIGKTHKYNIFPNLAVFRNAEEKSVIKPKSRPPINTWTEEDFKKKKYKKKDIDKVFEDIKKLHPWLTRKGGEDD